MFEFATLELSSNLRKITPLLVNFEILLLELRANHSFPLKIAKECLKLSNLLIAKEKVV